MEFRPRVLQGPTVRLSPLSRKDLPELRAAGSARETWRFLPYGDASRPSVMARLVREALRGLTARTEVPMTVRVAPGWSVAGMTRFLHLQRNDRTV
ncbi:MAG TPA: hypothetical protein VJS68_04550 [Thermoplasmata archaeon]|nr:hypothetical protein [Thermoplasmata archaeon]